MRGTWRKKHLLAFFSVALMVLGSTGSTFTQQAQQSQAKRDDLLPLHIAVGPISLLRMPSWVALNEGIYKKNGLDVDQCQTRVTLEELKALGITPPADFYACPELSGAGPTLTAQGQGGTDTTPGFLANLVGRDGPITMAGGFPTFLGQVLNPTARKRVMILSTSDIMCWPIYTRKGITTPAQLKGGRIAVLASTDIHGFMAREFAEAMGWDPNYDMILVSEWGAPAFKDLEAGKLDAVVASDSAQILAMEAGYEPLVDLRQWKVPMPSAAVNADVQWLAMNRETARRFVKSQIEARAVMEKDRGAFNRALVKYYNMTDPKMQDKMYSMMDILPRKPYPAIDGIRKAIKLFGDIYPELKEHRAEEFVDDSFVRELDESGYIDSLYK
jgi:NitT/TauT family transport system substrate-binding protein